MSDAPIPVQFIWERENGVMRCHPRYLKLARAQFQDGEEYPLEIAEARSIESHRAYFASIRSKYQTMPDELGARWPSAEHLRHSALIHVGYCDMEEIVCDDAEQARRFGAFLRKRTPYSVIRIRENVLQHFNAQSQSEKAMNKRTFEDSKRKVLDWIDDQIADYWREHRRATDAAKD